MSDTTRRRFLTGTAAASVAAAIPAVALASNPDAGIFSAVREWRETRVMLNVEDDDDDDDKFARYCAQEELIFDMVPVTMAGLAAILEVLYHNMNGCDSGPPNQDSDWPTKKLWSAIRAAEGSIAA